MPNPFRLRRMAWLLALASLCGCVPAQPDVVSTKKTPRLLPAPGQADTQSASYAEVKSILQGMRDEGLTVPFGGPGIPTQITMEAGLDDKQGCMQGYPCVLDLLECTSRGSDYLDADLESTGNGAMSGMANIAYEVMRLQAILGAAGYPTETWQPLVSKYESDALEALAEAKPTPPVSDEAWSEYVPGLEDALHESLKESLNAYRATHAPSLPEISIEAGCGAGDIGIHVATSPANGRSRFIPVFYYRLCRARGVDPDSENACDYWKEPADGVLFDVAGDYQYRVDWPDGSKRQGKFSFTNLEDGQTVTISKP
ncbi:MAG: hypothetical protein ABIP44_13410 [Pseudoxanthomonas sp.]